MKAAMDRDLDASPEGLEIDVVEGNVGADGRVVDHNIDSAEGLDRGLGHGVDGGRVAHVRHGGYRLAALLSDAGGDFLAEILRLDRIDHQGRTRMGKLLGDRAPDVAGTPCHDRDLAGEFIIQIDHASLLGLVG